jgi:hypothetical protein
MPWLSKTWLSPAHRVMDQIRKDSMRIHPAPTASKKNIHAKLTPCGQHIG